MENKFFKKGDRVEVIYCCEYQQKRYGYQIGFTGTVNEDESENPWILFDDNKANFVKDLGTAVYYDELKLINN